MRRIETTATLQNGFSILNGNKVRLKQQISLNNRTKGLCLSFWFLLETLQKHPRKNRLHEYTGGTQMMVKRSYIQFTDQQNESNIGNLRNIFPTKINRVTEKRSHVSTEAGQTAAQMLHKKKSIKMYKEAKNTVRLCKLVNHLHSTSYLRRAQHMYQKQG